MRIWLTLGAVGLAAIAAALVYIAACTPQQSAPPGSEYEAAETTPSETETDSERATQPPDTADTQATAAEPDATAEAVIADMRSARDCYLDPDCHRGDADDPRGHYYLAGREVADGLDELRARYRDGELGADGLAAVAREFLEFDNPHAQGAALAALGEVPPEPRNLEAITEALDQHHAVQLFEPALAELQRYDDEAAQERIDDFLQSNLRTGAHHAAETIARELTPFLRDDNVAEFAAIADDLRADSRRAQLIRSAIDEYQQERSDG